MNSSPLVSVIVPVYNNEKYFSHCLDSILSQLYENLEVIIINDGSTDRSGAVADSFSIKDNRIRVVHKQNQGVSAARNDGMELAKGEYIAFVDSDDLIHRTYIKNLIDTLLKSGADIVTNGVVMSSLSDSDFLSTNVAVGTSFRQYNRGEALAALYRGTLENGNNGQQIMRSTMLDKHKLRYSTDMAIGEDFDFLARAILFSDTVAVDDRQMYYYRRNENSAVHQEFSLKQYQAIENVQKAGRSALSELPELRSVLDDNLIVNSISYGALMYQKRKEYPREFDVIKHNISKLGISTMFSKNIKLNGRIKIIIVGLFGKTIGLMIVRKLIRL